MVERIIVGSLYTNSYVVSTGKKECMIVDPGADAPLLLNRLEILNVIPTAIVFTHGHLDHTSAAQAIIDHYADRVEKMEVGIHRSDRSYLPPKGEQTNRELFEPLGEEAARVVDGPAELESTLREWLKSPQAARRQGVRAQKLVLSQQGATAATVEIVAGTLKSNQHKFIQRAA